MNVAARLQSLGEASRRAGDGTTGCCKLRAGAARRAGAEGQVGVGRRLPRHRRAGDGRSRPRSAARRARRRARAARAGVHRARRRPRRDRRAHRGAGNRQERGSSRRGARAERDAFASSSGNAGLVRARRSRTGRSASSCATGSGSAFPSPRRACASSCARVWRQHSGTRATTPIRSSQPCWGCRSKARRRSSSAAQPRQRAAADLRGCSPPGLGPRPGAAALHRARRPPLGRRGDARRSSRQLLPATDEEVAASLLLSGAEHEHGAWDLDRRARRRYRHRFEELELLPLEQPEAVDARAGAAGASLPDPVAALLAERSGGNPFFLEEALRDLIERGVLRRSNGRLELANGGEVTVPSLVQEALQARLDRLEPEAREVISVASVVGRSFGMPLLEQLIEHESLLPGLCRAAAARSRRRGAPPTDGRVPLPPRPRPGGRIRDARRGAARELHGRRRRRAREAPSRLARRGVRPARLALQRGRRARGGGRVPAQGRRRGPRCRRQGRGARALPARARLHGEHRRPGRARDTLLKIALTHHLAFDFKRAGAAYDEAFALPAPLPVRLEPSERIAIPLAPRRPLRAGLSPTTSTAGSSSGNCSGVSS